MGVTFIAKEGTYTAPAKLVTKEITENGTYDATDDSANGYSSVTVNVEGGGGSSDFSTAEVELIGNPLTFNAPIIIDYVGGQASTYAPKVAGVYTVPLYNGVAIINCSVKAGQNLSVDGAITNISSNHWKVTGDCTITISMPGE